MLSESDWNRVHEINRAHQEAAKADVLCMKKLKRRLRKAARGPQSPLKPMPHLGDVEEYLARLEEGAA